MRVRTILISLFILASFQLYSADLPTDTLYVQSDFSGNNIVRCFISKGEIKDFKKQLESEIYAEDFVLAAKRNGYEIYGEFDGTAYLSYQFAYEGAKKISITASPLVGSGNNPLGYSLSFGDKTIMVDPFGSKTDLIDIGDDFACCGSFLIKIKTNGLSIDELDSYSSTITVEVSNT